MREYALTPQQQNIYEMVKRYPGSCIGNIGGVFRFGRGDGHRNGMAGQTGQNSDCGMQSQRLYETVCRVQELNPALRLRVNCQGKLYLSEQCAVPFEVTDGREASEEEIRRRIQNWMDLPVFGYDACLVRYLLIEARDALYLAGLCHHLICDGIGLIKVSGEIFELGRNPDSPLWTDAVPDHRYLSYLEEMELRIAKPVPEAYRRLCVQEHFVFPDRRESASEKAEVFRKKVEREFGKRLTNWCERNGLTVEHAWEAALAMHDCGITGAQWTALGRVMINRKKRYMDTAGMFANVLPLVVQVCSGTSFSALCREIQKQEFMLLKCGDLTAGELKAAACLTGRLYDCCVTYRSLKRLPLRHADYMWETECSAVEVPLRLMIDEQPDGIWLTYKYMSDRYSRKEIGELDRLLQEMIGKGIGEESEELCAAGTEKLRTADRSDACALKEQSAAVTEEVCGSDRTNVCVLKEQSGADMEDVCASDRTYAGAAERRSAVGAGTLQTAEGIVRTVEDVADAFDRNVQTFGNREFIIDIKQKGRRISYREAGVLVERIADGLAALQKKGLEKSGSQGTQFHNKELQSKEFQNEETLRGQMEQREPLMVGLKLSRTMWMPLAMLACLKTGIVFVPVAVSETEERLAALRSQLDLILTDAWVQAAAEGRLFPDIEAQEAAQGEARPLCEGERGVVVSRTENTPYLTKKLAYGIHTSGSTGTPKLVRLYREALNLRLAWMKETFGLSGCRILQKTRNTFDVSVWELLLPVVSGGSLVMLPDGWEREPYKILEVVERYQVDTLHFVPSMLSVYLSWAEHAGEAGRTSVKRVFSSGEALSPAMVERFYNRFPFTKLYNLYGPAECTIDVSWHACHRGEGVVPVGTPVWDTELLVVNRKGQEIPYGYIGEILVVGALVGEGYVDNPQETAAHFCEWNGRRAYRTGDLGYYLDNGELVYAGRMDREVKLRGMRVSLSLLEQEASAVSGVKGAAAMVLENRLFLFAETEMTPSGVRRQLVKRVAPHYMPDVLLCLESLPYNRNGKCDYAALPAIYDSQRETGIGMNRQKSGTNGQKAGMNGLRTGTNEQKAGMSGWKTGINGKNNGMNGRGFRTSGTLLALMDTACKVLGQAAPLTPEDSLRECGLDSISIVEWMLALEKQGIRVTYEDIAGSETLRELAKLLAARKQKEGIKERSLDRLAADRKLLRNLTSPIPSEKRRGFVVAVPYAGMGIQCFSTLAGALADRGYELLGCDVSGRRWSVSAMAEQITKELEGLKTEPAEAAFQLINVKQVSGNPNAQKVEEELVVLGCCVGSALAVSLVDRFKQIWHGPVHLALVGSLPTGFLGAANRQKLLWDLLPVPATELCLSALQGRRVRVTDEMLMRLKMDAKNYVQWMTNWKDAPVEVDAQLLFGSRDILTAGFRQRYTQWNRFLSGHIRVTELEGAYHFCLHTHGEEIAERIV